MQQLRVLSQQLRPKNTIASVTGDTELVSDTWTKADVVVTQWYWRRPLSAVMDALAAHSTMSKQALDSARVRDGLKDVLLGPGRLYEALRDRGASSAPGTT